MALNNENEAKIRIGALDILIGVILITFIVVFQGISFFVILGVLYLILGLRMAISKKMMFGLFLFGIVPLTILSIFSTIMLGTNKIPEYFRLPLLMQFIFIVVLSWVCFLNYKICKRRKE